MPTTASASVAWHPHQDHLFQVGVLIARATDRLLPAAARREASAELTRLRDQGLIIQKYGKEQAVAKKTRAHATPKADATTFTGQGIIFAVVDNREEMERGATTIDTIADGIEAALDAGHETSEEIARYLTTSAFQHIADKRVRFNSVLKAGDVVGAYMLRKLYNTYNELAKMAEDEEDTQAKKLAAAEARGFAEALTIVLSPFSSEDPKDPRLINWDEVDRMTDNFEKEQRLVRRERKGNPQ
ncbi:hypothetical protein PBI_RACCOON_46 [Microbacterium phage Raccoon]|uniref:Uncharacterized protein n=1 Tax=Microbacterium phage Raccoon TaxID=2079590 RepID=A0A2L0HNH3_9CAUD|nr:hypothetical protein PBI_RACCOON_46 [Microbacterium phage Raccoon]QKY80283.1 hypothetical protein SEA_LEAFUS_46 [Microbacterium phage Leafus]